MKENLTGIGLCSSSLHSSFCAVSNFIIGSFADTLAHCLQNLQEGSVHRNSLSKLGKEAAGTVLSFLSFLNSEISGGIFSGDRYRFQNHSTGV